MSGAEPALRYRGLWLGMGWALLALILFLALRPLPGVALVEIWSDKVWHALAFATLMLWFAGAYPSGQLWKVFALLLCYGLLIELLQSFTRTRHVEVADMVANLAGATTGWLLARAGLRRWCAWLEGVLVRL